MINKPKTLILGIGNTIRGDDGVGIFATRTLREQMVFPDVDIKETEQAGLSLWELIRGYERVIIIDSIRTENGKPGSVYRFAIDDFKRDSKPYSSHQLGLATVLNVVDWAKLEMPKDITIYAIEVKKNDQFNEEINDKVKKAVPKIVKQIKWEFKNGNRNNTEKTSTRYIRA